MICDEDGHEWVEIDADREQCTRCRVIRCQFCFYQLEPDETRALRARIRELEQRVRVPMDVTGHLMNGDS